MTTQQDERAELPPLPDGKAVVRGPVSAFNDPESGTLVDFDCEGPLSYDPDDGEELFTADQMREYARAALLAADAQAGGEVVAWIRPSGKAMLEAGGYCTVYASDGMSNHSTPLYAHPQPQAVAQGWKLNGPTAASGTAHASPAAPAAAQVAQPLTVWFDQMPESNGKRNWTVMLRRKDSEGLLGSISSGVCFERTEYYDQARYAADRLRFLIGELAKEPDILDYDPDILQPEEAHGIGKDQS